MNINELPYLINKLREKCGDYEAGIRFFGDGSGSFRNFPNEKVYFYFMSTNGFMEEVNNYLDEEYFPVAENLPNLEPTFGQISQNMSTINSVANNINEVTELPERGLNLRDINADYEQYGYLDDKQVQYLLDRTEQLSHALAKVHELLENFAVENDALIERVTEAQESLV